MMGGHPHWATPSCPWPHSPRYCPLHTMLPPWHQPLCSWSRHACWPFFLWRSLATVWHLLPTLPGCWHESLWASYPFAGDCFVGGCVPPSGHRDVRAVGGGAAPQFLTPTTRRHGPILPAAVSGSLSSASCVHLQESL